MRNVKTRTYGKGEHLSRAGDVSDTLFFVQTGLLRYYYLLDGVEHTGQFFDEGSFVADVRSLTGNVAALQSIDALEATTVICISGAALQRSFDSDHAMERFGRKVIEEAMAGSQRRSASLLMRSPEQRYADLIQSRPAIVRQVPQYVIASYLAVTPESLSRIRSRRASSRTS